MIGGQTETQPESSLRQSQALVEPATNRASQLERQKANQADKGRSSQTKADPAKHTQWSVDKDSVVELRRRRSYVQCFHFLEASERMTLRNELGYRSLVDSSSHQQNDVVDHVTIAKNRIRINSFTTK